MFERFPEHARRAALRACAHGVATAALAGATWPLGSAAAQDAQRHLIIQNVRIFDGVRVLPERAVLIRGGLIAEIGTRSPRLLRSGSSTAQGKRCCPA